MIIATEALNLKVKRRISNLLTDNKKGNIMGEFGLSDRSHRRLIGTKTWVRLLIERSLARSPIDFGIPEYGGHRKKVLQKSLFDKGLSRCDGVNKLSAHQTGNAFDIYAYINGAASWDKIQLAVIAGVILSEAKLMKEEGFIDFDVEWGGTYSSDEFHGWDMGHFQKKM